MHMPDCVVVRIKQVVVGLVEARVGSREWFEHKVLEKPGDMCEMPLRRADVGHCLHHRIFGLQLGN